MALMAPAALRRVIQIFRFRLVSNVRRVKGGVRMMEIRWMNGDVNRPSGIDEGRRRR